YLRYILIIIFFTLISLARPFAVPDLVFQAYPEFPCLNIRDTERQIAGTERIYFFDQVQNSMHHTPRCIRTKINRPVLNNPPGPEYPWERLIFDDDPGIGLIIFQQNIIPGLMLLDETIFQEPGINLRIYDGECDV